MYRAPGFLLLVCCLGLSVGTHASPPIKLESLLRSALALDDNIEVIASLFEIAPNQALPRHYHPDEEFVYVLEGSATLWQKDKADVTITAGEVYKIPFEQVHTAITTSEAVKVLVFRVHEKGRAERYPAND